jgi:8-oxo-dGTP diphosphatase
MGSSHVLAVGVVRRANEVLLVRQGGPKGPGTVWALPGGRVEDGELAVEAVVREVLEETAAAVPGTARILCVGQMSNAGTLRMDSGELPGPGETALVLVFELWAGAGDTHHRGDPDGDITEAAWHDFASAGELLSQHPFPFMRAVAQAALVAAADGTVRECYFRRTADGRDIPIQTGVADAPLRRR